MTARDKLRRETGYRGLFPETQNSRRDHYVASQYHQGRMEQQRARSDSSNFNALSSALFLNDLRIKTAAEGSGISLVRSKVNIPTALETKLLDLNCVAAKSALRQWRVDPRGKGEVKPPQLLLKFSNATAIRMPEQPAVKFCGRSQSPQARCSTLNQLPKAVGVSPKQKLSLIAAATELSSARRLSNTTDSEDFSESSDASENVSNLSHVDMDDRSATEEEPSVNSSLITVSKEVPCLAASLEQGVLATRLPSKTVYSEAQEQEFGCSNIMEKQKVDLPEISSETYSVLAKIATESKAGETKGLKTVWTNDSIHKHLTSLILGTKACDLNLDDVGSSQTRRFPKKAQEYGSHWAPLLKLPSSLSTKDESENKWAVTLGTQFQLQDRLQLGEQSGGIINMGSFSTAESIRPSQAINSCNATPNCQLRGFEYLQSINDVKGLLEQCALVEEPLEKAYEHVLIFQTRTVPLAKLWQSLKDYVHQHTTAFEAKKERMHSANPDPSYGSIDIAPFEATRFPTACGLRPNSGSSRSFQDRETMSSLDAEAENIRNAVRLYNDLKKMSPAHAESLIGDRQLISGSSEKLGGQISEALKGFFNLLFEVIKLQDPKQLGLVAFECLYQSIVWIKVLELRLDELLPPLQSLLIWALSDEQGHSVYKNPVFMMSTAFLETHYPFLGQNLTVETMYQVFNALVDLLGKPHKGAVESAFRLLSKLFSTHASVICKILVESSLNGLSQQTRLCAVYLLKNLFGKVITDEARVNSIEEGTLTSDVDGGGGRQSIVESCNSNLEMNTEATESASFANSGYADVSDSQLDSYLVNDSPNTTSVQIVDQVESVLGSVKDLDSVENLPEISEKSSCSRERYSIAQQSPDVDTLLGLIMDSDLLEKFFEQVYTLSWRDCSPTLRLAVSDNLLTQLTASSQAIAFIAKKISQVDLPFEERSHYLDHLLSFTSFNPRDTLCCALIPLFSDVNSTVRLKCCLILGKFSHAIVNDCKLRAALLQRLDDLSEDVRTAALVALGKSKWDTMLALEVIVWVIVKDNSPRVLEASIQALEALELVQKFPSVLQFLQKAVSGSVLMRPKETDTTLDIAEEAILSVMQWAELLIKHNPVAESTRQLILPLLAKYQSVQAQQQDTHGLPESVNQRLVTAGWKAPGSLMFLTEPSTFETFKLGLLPDSCLGAAALEPKFRMGAGPSGSKSSCLGRASASSASTNSHDETIAQTIRNLSTKAAITSKLFGQAFAE